MAETNRSASTPLERHRGYLLLLAQMRLDQRFQGKLDASDIVQQTLLKAHEAQEQWRGQTPAELAAWLRQILVRTIADAMRDLRRAKRNVGRERSLEDAVANSSCRLEAWLSAEQPSPSGMAARHEQLLRLADALLGLPEPQRAALFLRHCEDLTLEEIGERLGRSPAAVASLLRRGLKALRGQLTEEA